MSGCSSYYEVKEPGSSIVYYTQKIVTKDSGAITFENAKTKTQMTLQSSEVKEISSDAYEAAVGQ